MNSTETDCPICNNSRFIVCKGEDGYDYAKPCKCAAEYNFKRRVHRSGLTYIINEYTFDKYETKHGWQKHIKEKALEFIENTENNWFFIGGQVGSGKTHICTAIVIKLLEKGMDAYYMQYRQDIMELKMNMDDFYSYSARLNNLKTVKVLYIDDLFKATEKPPESDIRIMFDLLNYRYINKDLITIISTERSINEILEIDQAIGSRIYQRSKNFTIKLGQDKSANYRMKQHPER